MGNADLLEAADGGPKLGDPAAWNTRWDTSYPTTRKLVTENHYVHVYRQDCCAHAGLPRCQPFQIPVQLVTSLVHVDVAERIIEGALRLHKEGVCVPRSQRTPIPATRPYPINYSGSWDYLGPSGNPGFSG